MSKYGLVYSLMLETLKNMRKLDARNETKYTLSSGDITILKQLEKQDETITSLTEILEYDKAFISRRVQFLVEEQFLVKKPLNLKSQSIAITAEGIEKLKKAQNRIDAVYQNVITPEQVEILLALVSDLNDKICAELSHSNEKEEKVNNEWRM